MQQDKFQSIDKQKTNESLSNAPSLDYPTYLDIVKQNLELSLPAYKVMILSKQNDSCLEDQQQTGIFSLVLTSHKLHRGKFQIFTEALLDQTTYCFYVRHIVTHNHRQLLIQNRQSISMALNFCNKINKQMGKFRLVIDPVSGKIYFQTKSFINESSLTYMKKNVLRQDCFYTEIIYCSTRKAQNYMQLILFLLGYVSLCEIITNNQISTQFPFLTEAYQILQRLKKNIFYLSFLDMDQKRKSRNIQNGHDNDRNNIESNHSENWKSSKLDIIQFEKEETQYQQKTILSAKYQILNNSLQYFSHNTQKTIKLFTPKNPYQNTDFSVSPINFYQQNAHIQRTAMEFDRKSSVKIKSILSFIEVVQVQKQYQGGQEIDGWKNIFNGGFGIIELGSVKYINLQNSYKQPETGFRMMIKQQMIRKRDINLQKNKIQRQRKILQKLQFFTHKNIMNFYISFQAQYQNCIFSDYTPNMSLDLYLKQNKYSISFSQKISFINQAVQGLLFLHDKNIVHLDIKPGNMLVNKQLKLLLSDFGEAFVIGQDDPITHNHAYTIPYCAPQIFLQKTELTEKVDIYAIGVCIFRVLLVQSFMDTFLREKFVKKLRNKEIMVLGMVQKYERSFLYPILKIILLVAYKAVSEESNVRPQLWWIRQILTQCCNFIFTLIY